MNYSVYDRGFLLLKSQLSKLKFFKNYKKSFRSNKTAPMFEGQFLQNWDKNKNLA